LILTHTALASGNQIHYAREKRLEGLDVLPHCLDTATQQPQQNTTQHDATHHITSHHITSHHNSKTHELVLSTKA
jgi:hypothetical protein